MKAIKSTMRTKKQRILDITETAYAEYLTAFAFDKLRTEYKKFGCVELVDIDIVDSLATTIYKENVINITEQTCQCWFYSTMELPCRHIFKLLAHINKNMYVPELCARRWTREYYNILHPIFNLSDPNTIRKTSSYVQ